MTLTEQCLELPYKLRSELCHTLMKSIREERRRWGANNSRAEILKGYMEEILGEPYQQDSRDPIYVWARTMVSFQLGREGFTPSEIGRMLGKNHSTIIHLRHKMQDALDYAFAYKDVINIWKQFQKLIQDDIQRGTIDNPVGLGGELPDCSKCEMGEESGEIRTQGDLGDLHESDRGHQEIL